MKWSRVISLFQDLIQVLPERARLDWQEMTKIDPRKPTVVLVSGFAATNRNLSVMRKRFIKDGFNVVVLPMDWYALSDGYRGLYRMAEKLSSLVLELRKGPCKLPTKVFLVAHSAGGLVARYYVQVLGGDHYCDGLITMATPHRGTWVAFLGLFCHLILKARCLLQMLPISPFMKRINSSPLPVGFPVVSFFSSDDMLCPERSTKVSVAASPEFSAIKVEGLSHGDFLLSKKMYRLLRRSLGVPDNLGDDVLSTINS